MNVPAIEWPYSLTFQRLALALAIGLFVGLERERRGKESGLRTFGFAALLGCLGGLLGEGYALLSIFLLGLVVVFMNIQSLRADQGTELTTSTALLVIGMSGVLCGQGQTFTPVAVAVASAALLMWKERLVGLSLHLSDAEVRSAVLLAILGFVIYPALPVGSIDPWHVLVPREAFVTIILIAGIGFINYILWKIYGTRGVVLTGFLGGLVNSTVAVSELAARVKDTNGQLSNVAYRGSLLATSAMIVRNMVILTILAPSAMAAAALAHAFMLTTCIILIGFDRRPVDETSDAPLLHLESPFSLKSAVKYGFIFLALQIVAVVAQQVLGQLGVYVTSLFGGLVSSASAVAAAASLSSQGTIPAMTAGVSAVIASITSALVNLPLIFRAQQRNLTIRFAWATSAVLIFGFVGAIMQVYMAPTLHIIVP